MPARDLNRFLSKARRALGLPHQSVSVCLVTNAEMARWNRTYRGKSGPTDVLSFPADKTSGAGGARAFPAAHLGRPRAKYLGDIGIAPAVARRNARRFGRTLGDEVRILILHGMLHLMGYDHETDRGQMERREQRLRRALGLG